MAVGNTPAYASFIDPASSSKPVFVIATDLTTDFEDPCDFLALVAGSFPSNTTFQLGFIGKGNKKKRLHYPVSVAGLDDAWSDIDDYNDDHEQRHVYFSPHARTSALRGAAAVQEMHTVCADLDCGEGQLKDGTDRPKFSGKEAAHRHLDQAVATGLVPPPTFIVDSGSGVHVHWSLGKPVPRSEEALYRKVMMGLAIILQGDMAVARSLDVQMRVPGTVNWKDPTGNQLARVVHFENIAHLISDFPAATDEDLVRYAGSRRHHSSRRARQIRSTRPSHTHQSLIDALNNASLSTRRAWDGRGEFVRTDLESCPLCGAKPGSDGSTRTWTANISPHLLRLHCWRPDCQANKKPLPLPEWLPLVLPDPPRTLDGILPIDVQDCERVLDERIATAFDLADQNVIPIIEGELGCGKTTRMLHRMVQDAAEGRGGTIIVPTHALAQEKAEQLRAIARSVDVDITVVQATSMAQCCIHKDRLRSWVRHVKSWTHQVCRSCDHFNECAVHTQFRDLDRDHTVVVGVHHYLPQMNRKGVLGHYVVIDEASSSFEKEQRWTRSHLEGILKSDHPWCQARHMAAGFLLALLNKADEHHQSLKENANDGDLPAKFGLYIYGEDLKELIAEVVDGQGLDFNTDCHYHTNQPPPQQGFDVLTQKNPARSTPPLDFDDLVHYLDDVAMFFESDTAKPVFLRFYLDVPHLKVPVVMLDATASASISVLEAYYPDTTFELLPVRVEEPPHVRRVHLETTSYMSKRITSAPTRVRTSLQNDAKTILGLARKWLPGNPTFGLITPKKLEETAAQIFKEQGVEVVTGHFGDIRGTNRFECVNALVLIGDYVPNVNRCEYESHILGIGVGDRIRSVMRSEGLQAAGRGRAIRREENSPLLLISASKEYLLGVPPEVLPTTAGRRGEKWKQVADIAAGFLEAHGFVATRLFHPPGLRGGLLEVGPNGYKEKVLNSQLGPTPPNSPEIQTPGQLRKLRKTIRKVAEQSGATARWVSIPAGRIQVWETRQGAYDEWANRDGGNAAGEG